MQHAPILHVAVGPGRLLREAAAELLISLRAWLLGEDFLQVAVEFRWDVYRDREVQAIDFAAAADAVIGSPTSRVSRY